MELFTSGAVSAAVECWQWIISARPDLEFCFLQEMSAAWQYAFEKRMGLFVVEDEDAVVNPLAVHEGAELLPAAPLVEPHDLWIRFLIERIEIAKHCSQDQVQIFFFPPSGWNFVPELKLTDAFFLNSRSSCLPRCLT